MSFYFEYVNNFLLLKSTLFDDIPLRYAFGTRIGKSRLDDDALVNLPDNNRYILFRDAFLDEMYPDRIGSAVLRQVHSNHVWIAKRSGDDVVREHSQTGKKAGVEQAEGDALMTIHPCISLLIRTADCYPVILFDQEFSAVAIVHSGWRGTLAEISESTIQSMGSHFGSRPEKIHAVVGPGIQSCCYEIDRDLAARFESRFPGCIKSSFTPGGAYFLDLPACLRSTLLKSGILESNLDICPICTACHPQVFHSYRRDATTAGRMISSCMLPPGI